MSIRKRFIVGALLCTLAVMNASAKAADPLPSWNEGKTKQSILIFVAAVTQEGAPEFVPPPERIATFDNDGTLWAEQPMYFQLAFAIDRVKALAGEHPEWQQREPYKSILAGDLEAALSGGMAPILEIINATHAGMTTEEFEVVVKQWLATARHPRTGHLYSEMIYQPMLELLVYLRANGFKTFIVSGGGVEFMRAFAEKAYGIPPEQVIGSVGKQSFELRAGKPALVKLPALDYFDDKDAKPIAIQRHIGRRPVAAFGNSDGDLQMMQWTAAGQGARFCLFVRHTDAGREWAYDRSPMGILEKGLAEAAARGWTVVDVKRDWRTIFPAH